MAEPAGEEGFIALVAGTEQVCHQSPLAQLSSSVMERRVYYPLVKEHLLIDLSDTNQTDNKLISVA